MAAENRKKRVGATRWARGGRDGSKHVDGEGWRAGRKTQRGQQWTLDTRDKPIDAQERRLRRTRLPLSSRTPPVLALSTAALTLPVLLPAVVLAPANSRLTPDRIGRPESVGRRELGEPAVRSAPVFGVGEASPVGRRPISKPSVLLMPTRDSVCGPTLRVETGTADDVLPALARRVGRSPPVTGWLTAVDVDSAPKEVPEPFLAGLESGTGRAALRYCGAGASGAGAGAG